MSSKTTTVAAALMALPFLACAPASATTSTLVVGGPGNGVNYIPFSSAISEPEYQQVYASSDFSSAYTGSITIDDITFEVASGAGTPNTSKMKITLSTTNAAVNDLNTNLYNFGSRKTVVYNAKLPSISDDLVTFTLTTPFVYNPAAGNLIIDIDGYGMYSGSVAFAFNSASDGAFSRVYSDFTGVVDNNSGLVTGFTVVGTPVPEPSTWAMMVLGFAGLGFAGYRASRRATATAAV